MKKYFIIATIFVIVLFILFLISFIISIHRTTTSNSSAFPTPTGVVNQLPNASQEKLAITQTVPTNNATNIATDTKIVISFNKNVSSADFTFALGPSVDYQTAINGQVLTVTPTNSLSPGSIYNFKLQFADGSFSQNYSFTTAGQGPALSPATYDNLRQLQSTWDKSFAPDVYIANHTPYTTNDFSISSQHQATPPEHYYFSVFLKGTDQNAAKQAFLSWLASLGLTLSQINSLDITYYGGQM